MSLHPANLLSIIAISFLVTLLATPLVKRAAAKMGCIDQPGARKMHSTPVPRLGGVAIYLGFLVAVLTQLPMTKTLMGILAGSGIIMCLGIIDDRWSLTPSVKLMGQIVAALVTVAFGIQIDFISNPLGGILFLGAWTVPVTVFWIVALINTMNLIDGLDGLAAGLTAISVTVLGIVALQMGQWMAAVMSLAMLGSCLAFLKYNFSPAQIFMGDVGAMFLGYLLATTSIVGVLKGPIAVSFIIPVLALGVPLSDTAFAIVRRLKNKKRVFEADDRHVHHRLIRRGFSPKQATLTLYSISLLLGSLAVIMSVH